MSIGGKIYKSLRERGPQTVAGLAGWLRLEWDEVFELVCSDDRVGWIGWPESDLGCVMVSVVTPIGLQTAAAKRR